MPAPHSFKKTCPCTILPPPFFNFSDPPSGGGNQNLLPTTFKKRGGRGGPNYGQWTGNLNDSTCVFNLTICLQNNSLSYDMSVYDPTLILGGLDNFEVIYFLGAQLYWNFSRDASIRGELYLSGGSGTFRPISYNICN